MTTTVSQEAREAAEKLFDAILANMGAYAEWGSPSYREAALREIEQSIRQQAERDTLARMQPVAWMYEYRGGVVAVTATRYDRGTIKALGYVETPLYALPPAPEAGQ